jgi:hypothetical protein
MVSTNQRINILAIGLLECMGNLYPTQEQIDLMESLLETYMLDRNAGNGLKLKRPLPVRRDANLNTYFGHYLA